MSFLQRRYQPEEVFTPRSFEVNELIYIARPELETVLRNALRGSQHVVVHGESGSGKSWLYKKVLKDTGAEWSLANLANASRLGSITKEIQNSYERSGHARKTGFTETKAAEVGVAVAKGGLSHQATYEYTSPEPFEQALFTIRRRAGKRLAVLVLDNLESIFEDRSRMAELADLVVLLDDDSYARHQVRMLIVGVPGELREYFNRTRTRATVANRLYEIPEVARLTPAQCNELVETGFVRLLGFNIPERDLADLQRHVAWVTDRIPQRIHEYCLELARLGSVNNDVPLLTLTDATDRIWLQSALANAYAAVEAAMNVRETKVGRRNQTLYAIGRIDRTELRLTDVEEMVRKEFPASTEDRALNISGMLYDLGDMTTPLIKRSPKGDAWVFADPRYRMCIRLMLRKSGEVVDKLETGEI